MSDHQFRLLLIGFGSYLAAQFLVWGGFWAYLVWRGIS